MIPRAGIEIGHLRLHLRFAVIVAILAFAVASLQGRALSASSGPSSATAPLSGGAIKHVVVIYQENHSFNDLLGKLCVDENNRCLGTTQGTISTGQTIPLKLEPDVSEDMPHEHQDMMVAIDGGKMDGWNLMPGGGGGIGGSNCSEATGFACLVQADTGTVPTLWSLADAYAISDMTFETARSASWGSHINLVAATMDGFLGDQPKGAGVGNGCDTQNLAFWSPGGGQFALVPSCIPDKRGAGPFQPSPVKYVPTIMDRLEAAGKSWNIYAPGRQGSGYGWAICPTFYECLGSSQAKNVKSPRDFAKDAAKGKLPNFSIIIPFYNDSQHPQFSLLRGDNWIAENVNAIMDGPDWNSTVIFITYDDCGCYYDPVAPPPGYGMRVPMVVVSPFVKRGFVDHAVATDASMLALTEHVFGLQPLDSTDANAYDYANSFAFDQTPLPTIPLPLHRVPLSSLRYMQEHPPDPNDDPT